MLFSALLLNRYFLASNVAESDKYHLLANEFEFKFSRFNAISQKI